MDMFKHFLKWSQKFLRYPLQTSKIIFEDYQKQKDKSIYLKHNFVWCIGLPKSGTTFIEEIFESLNYSKNPNNPDQWYRLYFSNHHLQSLKKTSLCLRYCF